MKTMTKEITVEKEAGRFYTPTFIVNNILDLSGYCGQGILNKHVIDNSCGDGAFLCQIVGRYCKEFLNLSQNREALKKSLETYIHGIEIDIDEHKKCVENLSQVAREFDVYNVKWDVLCADATSVEIFNGKMDFVLGNPPYVRVHNLGDNFSEIKRFSFAQNGMTDLFIVFYELGIRMLSDKGVLGYITPSSYFNSIAGSCMRQYLVENNLLKAVVDLQHFQAFSATTYTVITILQNNREANGTDYYRYNKEELLPYYVEKLTPSEYYISGDFYFSTKESLSLLKKINCNCGKTDISVKNGYATLCDSVFISDFDFESPYIISAVKASKGIVRRIFFPYDQNGFLIDEEELKKDLFLYEYLVDNKEKLLKRSNEKSGNKYWYAFGRSQAIRDTFSDKMAINSLLRNEEDWKFTMAPANTGVYGGLYIVSKTISFEKIANVLRSKEFLSYISILGKYKQGGYYTFSSKDVKKFLDYKFAYDRRSHVE